MPGHHPIFPRASDRSLLMKPRREREQLVEEVCGRLSRELDHDVVTLKSLVTEPDPDFFGKAACPTPSRRSQV